MLTGKTGNSPFFPTVMAYDDGQWFYGIDAVNIPGAICDLKRMLGVPFDSPSLNEIKKVWASRGIKIRKEPVHPGKIYQGIQVGVQQKSGAIEWINPEDLAAQYIQWLCSNCIGENPTGKLAITYPAAYNQYQKDATKEVFKKAGFSEVHMLSEPSAAGLALANLETFKNQTFENLLVFDFGGGTLDVTLMTTAIFEQSFKVTTKIIDGDPYLGGRDIDDVLFDWTVKQLHEKGYSPDDDDNEMILEHCTSAKESLSQGTVSNCIILASRKKIGGKALTDPIRIDLPTFHSICETIFDRITLPVERILEDEKITADDVDGLLLVGGSSQTPKVQEVIREFFNNKPLITFSQKRECIAQGACIYAAIQTPGSNVISFEELNEKTGMIAEDPVVEKLAHSLGTDYIEIEKPDVICFSPILVKNQHGPGDSVTQTYRTMRDDQDKVHVGVYECDTQYIKDANLLKEYEVENITKKPKYEVVIEVTFFLDSNGMLIVTSREKGKDPIVLRFKYLLNTINQTAILDGLNQQQREIIRDRDIFMQISCLCDYFEDNPDVQTDEFKALVNQEESDKLYDEIQEALMDDNKWNAMTVDELMAKGRKLLAPFYTARSLPLPEQFGLPE